MEVLDNGHKYRLDLLDSDDNNDTIILTFVKREGENYPGNIGSYSGTTCQEVIRALIDRMQYLQGQIPCWQNNVIIFCLKSSIYMFELRHVLRKKLPMVYWQDMNKDTSSKDGHIIKN
jgi:hypothetical protein